MDSKLEMESRWYLSPGQSLETTKIEDRGHALHVTKKAWGKVTAHLDRNRLIQEAIDKEKAHKLALKEGSEQMTKGWDNSVENIRIRKEEERIKRLEKTKEDKMQKFLEVRKEQEAERQKYIEEATKALYISTGPPRTLTGALILSEVLYEREKQIELENQIQQHELEEAEKYAQKVKNGVEEERLEKLEKEAKLHEKKIEMRELYIKEIHKHEESAKSLKKGSVEREQLDTINAEKEFKKIKEVEFEEDKEKKARVKQEFNKFCKEQEDHKKHLELEEKETDLVINIYSKAKHQIQCLRKKKEQEMQEAMKARREAASKKAVAEVKAKAEHEELIIRRAMEEREQAELEVLKAKEIYQNQLIRDRNEDYARCMKREERRQFEEMEQKKWEMLNRCKKNEVQIQYEDDKKQREWEKVLHYREELLDQMAEDEIEREAQKDTSAKFEKLKMAADDKKFFDYAEECYQYAKSRGRTTLPIERVIMEYKKENNLPLTPVKHREDNQPET